MTPARVALIGRDLLFGSRIAGIVEAVGGQLVRAEEPGQLPPAASVRLVLVDWGDRQPYWAASLAAWRDAAEAPDRPQLTLFGPHTDLAAHADARAAGLGPMLARSAVLGWLSRHLSG